MDAAIKFRGLGYLVIGVLLLMMLIVSLISMRKEARADEPLRGLLWMAVFILALSTFVALSSTYFTARTFQKHGPRLQTQVVTTNDAMPQ
jgi:multisubunit Na+/H+ antiporter MnhB subunit